MRNYFFKPEARFAAVVLIALVTTLRPQIVWGDTKYELKKSFPRLMGMNIGAKNYHEPQYQRQLARLDVVILGFYPGWNPRKEPNPVRNVVRQLKVLNPRLLVGQYTVLNEAYDNLGRNKADEDKYRKLYSENWWLKKADGKKAQWSSEYGTWEVNITSWANPDINGRRYPEWLAERDYSLFFQRIPEFDIWYLDNVFAKPRIPAADWNRDGKNDDGDNPSIISAYRKSHVREWATAKTLAPGLLLVGNADNDLTAPEYRGQLNGVFLEGLIGRWWSLEARSGWEKMMERYRTAKANTAPPHLVGFNVFGERDDYRRFRYGFTSCLLDDGYFSYTDEDEGYSSTPWFDEYDVDLGQALDPPQTEPWQKGVYRRRFQKGIVLVNPSHFKTTVEIGPGYRAFPGQQDKGVNDGVPVTTLTIPGKDGIVLVRQ